MYCKYCAAEKPALIVISAPEGEWGYGFCSLGCAYKFLGMLME